MRNKNKDLVITLAIVQRYSIACMHGMQKFHPQPQPKVLVDVTGADFRSFPKNVEMNSPGNISTTIARELTTYIVSSPLKSPVTFFLDRIIDAYVFIKAINEILSYDSECVIQIAFIGKEITVENLKSAFFGDIAPSRQEAILGKYGKNIRDVILKNLSAGSDDELCFHTAKPGVWVFRRDSIAVRALTWVRNGRRAIPQRISLISLENSAQCLPNGISSCCLDWYNTGYVMARALIGDTVLERTGKGFLRVRARMIHRETTFKSR